VPAGRGDHREPGLEAVDRTPALGHCPERFDDLLGAAARAARVDDQYDLRDASVRQQVPEIARRYRVVRTRQPVLCGVPTAQEQPILDHLAVTGPVHHQPAYRRPPATQRILQRGSPAVRSEHSLVDDLETHIM